MDFLEQDSRTLSLIGGEALERIKNSRVAIFGVGGVGGFCAEAIARGGVARIDLFDCDRVSVSNVNRQIAALHSTVGKFKVDVMKERILDINPGASLSVNYEFLTADRIRELELAEYDYIIDAIDTVSVKIELAKRCFFENIPLISSMGTGNKLDPFAFKIADVFSTKVCPLARAMRSELRRAGVGRLLVLYSEEEPKEASLLCEKADGKRAPASVSFVPSVAGLLIASHVLKSLGGIN